MNRLNAMAVALGGSMLVAGLVGLGSPALARRALGAFPRNRTAGWLLTAVVLGWCGNLLYRGPIGFLEPYRAWLFLLIPVAVVMMCCFVEELLAARALGGLLILLPAPILDAARWHPSAWRYAPILLAYAMVLVGAWLVAAPYVFRKVVERLVPTDGACRRASVVLILAGAGFCVLGAVVF